MIYIISVVRRTAGRADEHLPIQQAEALSADDAARSVLAEVLATEQGDCIIEATATHADGAQLYPVVIYSSASHKRAEPFA